MGKLTLRQAADWCGGVVEEKYADIAFLGAANDTRVMQPGQLFIALQGARDGHDFIQKAMDKGAAAALCSRRVGDYPAIYVDDPRIALGQIAREELKRIGAKVVAVTGSVGKSTTKEMIAAVLEQAFVTSKTPANHNNDIGMPMAVLAMPENTEVAVLEMGMNHFGEISYLSQIARPDVAVIINIGTAHIEFLGTQEGIRQAKMEIVEGMTPHGMLLLNGDDFLLRNLDKEPQQRVTYFGSSEGCAVRAFDVNQDGDYLRFRVEAGRLSFPVKMLLEGEHYVNDALAAVTVLTAYIPMLTDAGGNAGSQSTSTIIRGMAVGEIQPHDLPRILWRESRVALLCGATLAVCNFAKLLLFDKVTAPVALVVCLTLICTILLSQLIGGLLPVAAEKLHVDPAVMASPLITTIVDATTLLIYFNVAKIVLHL